SGPKPIRNSVPIWTETGCRFPPKPPAGLNRNRLSETPKFAVTDSNVFQLSQPGALSDPLTEVLRSGARALLAQAVAAEVAWFLESHADKLTDDGRQRLVHHGHLPEREIMAIGRARSLEELAQRE